MSVDRSYVIENKAERERLRALVARLSDADLARPMPGGWTVATVLTHVAFWDQRIVELIDRCQVSGLAALPPALDEAHVDWINDAAKPMFLALDPRRAADLTVRIAETVDRRLESLPDDIVARYGAAGSPINLRRAEHRRAHLDEIERVLTA
jgi:uncharacterized damage-inducible protein DinB